MAGSAAVRALRRWGDEAWPLLQTTAGAAIAWVIAMRLGNHDDPFFAPIAAMIALNAARGERSLNALRLLVGVVIGIVAGEATVAVIGGGYGSLALAMFVAMAAARALSDIRLVVGQAGSGAILTVAVANGEAGVDRLLDALIGAGVALVFTQLLFTPEPVSLVRHAQRRALTGMAAGLALTADGLDRDDADIATQATERLREVRNQLAEVGRMKQASIRIVRHALIWRSRRAPVVQENENAGHLDLLGGSCLVLARTAISQRPPHRRALAPTIHDLAETLADLAVDPADRQVRQRAVDRSLAVARRFVGDSDGGLAPAPSALVGVQMVTNDIMVFAGVEPDQAEAAVAAGTGELQAIAPPPTSRIPFRSVTSQSRRGRRRSRRR